MTLLKCTYKGRRHNAFALALSCLALAFAIHLPVAAAPADASLIPNGNFELDTKNAGWPDGWPKPAGGSWEVENGNHFLRLTSTQPGQMTMLYRPVPIPAGTKALELSFRMRTTDLMPGQQPWYDARIMMNFKDAKNQEVKPGPPPPYARESTKGWVERDEKFLVPDGATMLEFMPALFQVEKGTFDLDDVVLKPIDAAPLLAAVEAAAQAERLAHVAPEPPQPAKWPQPLHVAGNRLVGRDGQPVWLQGVNVVSLEWQVQGDHVLRSAQVAVDDWKSNLIRLPVKGEFWLGKGQKDGGEAYRLLVDDAVNIIANRGAYVLLDLHHFGAPRDEDIEFWKSAAAKYKNHPAVLFDLFNEPHDISWQVWRDGGFVPEPGANAAPGTAGATPVKGFQSPGMQRLADAVRATGARNIVVAGGLDWAYDLSGITQGYALKDPNGDGIMYATHIYNWKRDWQNKVLVAVDKSPILVGETGADIKKMTFIPLDQQEDPYTWAPDMLGLIQKYKLNWTAWSFYPATTPVLITDWNYTPSPFWGAFVKRALGGEQFPLKKLR